MPKKNKWTYEVSIAYLNILFTEQSPPAYLNMGSIYVQKMCSELNLINPDEFFKEEDLMCKIYKLFSENKNLTFLQPSIPNGKFGKFFQSKDKYIKLDHKNIKEGLIKAILHVQSSFTIEPQKLCYDDSLSLHENISRMVKVNNLCELEVCAILYKQNDILIQNNNLIKQKEDNAEIVLDNDNQDLNKLRKEIGKAFNHQTKDYNLFLLNDGTGSGKTHNVVLNFIESYPNLPVNEKEKKRKSLIFIAPQKNQLFVDDYVFNEAEKSGIPLLFARSRDDITNLESKNYLDLNKKIKTFNNVSLFFDFLFKSFNKTQKTHIDRRIKDLFEERMKKINKISDTMDVDKIPSLFMLESCFHHYNSFENNNQSEKKYNFDLYENNLKLAKNNFSVSLNSLAKFFSVHIEDKILFNIFNTTTIYNGFSNFSSTFNKDDKLFELVYKILLYVMPFEVAKHINCIIYLTGDKSQNVIPISEVSARSSDIKIHKFYELEEIISGYSISKKVDVLSYSRDNANFGDFLEKKYFVKNDRNYFLSNNLGFSIVEDEEHVLYNLFVEKYTFKNITERKNNVQVNTIHAMASLARWIKNSQIEKRNILNFEKIIGEKDNIVKKLFSELKKHTVFQTEQEIENFFEAISSNKYGIFVKTSDYEFINSVCDNIISFSPKLIMLQDYLKSIKIVLDKGADYLLISKDNKEYKEDILHYSVFDLFQIILTALYVCKDCSQNLRSMLFTEKDNNNQNSSLYHLLNLAHENSEFLNNLFSSSLTLVPSDKVNLQFAYFLTKIGFNFTFPQAIAKQKFNKNYIPIEPHIFIIKELPEVNLLQILNNPSNKVFLLSATRGFNNTFAGNYSEYFFKEINQYLPNKIKIFQREKEVINPMPEFIETRFNKRTSIQVIKLKINNSRSKNNRVSDLVDSTLYHINQIKLPHLNQTNDIVAKQDTYNLIKGNSKNYLEELIINVKDTKKFKFLQNPYSKAEILGVFNSIIHAFEKNEHSIVMTLSNRFYTQFINDEEFRNSVFKNANPLRSDEENKFKVFEYAPIVNSVKKLRLICFDAALGKTPDLKDHFIIDPDTIIVLVSSYKSAGTGLNLTLSNKQLNQDFSSIYFINSSYYSSVMNNNGYGHLSNQLLVYKYFSHLGNKTIQDLSEGLSATKIKYVLKKEHIMEKVKAIMQSAGRIERRESAIVTKIYFLENEITQFFEESMSEFNEMFKLHSNQHSNTIVANFSMLSKSLLKTSLNHVAINSLSNKERNILEKTSKEHYETYYNFFCESNNFPRMLNQYRLSNPDFVWLKELNSIFRGYTNPNYDLKNLLSSFLSKHKEILQKTNCFSTIRNLLPGVEFDFVGYGVSKDKLITLDYENSCYSDYSKNTSFGNDKHFFGYGEDVKFHEVDLNEPFLKSTLINYSYTNTLTKLPNIYLSHIIKGNIGEQILSEYLNQKNIPFNKIDSLFNINVDMQIYELFDFYIVKNNTIYCIDTKNWTLYNDNGARKTLESFPKKIQRIKSIPEFKNYDFQFIYLNMFPSLNSAFTNGLSTHLGSYKDTKYINFITKEPKYELIKAKNTSEYYKKTEEFYTINNEWRNLI